MITSGHRISLCRGSHPISGASGWLLKWREEHSLVRLSHWFVNVNEAAVVKSAMKTGLTFEAAHAQLFAGQLDVDAMEKARAIAYRKYRDKHNRLAQERNRVAREAKVVNGH